MVERVTKSILDDFPGVDARFAPMPYSGHPPDGYDLKPFLHAATMLAQASARRHPVERQPGRSDRLRTGQEALRADRRGNRYSRNTTALETPALLNALGLPRIAILQQGDADEGDRLVAAFASQGISILARRDLRIRDNFEAAGVSTGEISRLASELAAGKPDAIPIWSTNFSGHSLTESLGAALCIPIFDSAAIGTISALRRLQEIFE